MGWNSWNKFQTHIDDAIVRGIADAIVSSGMKDAGYEYVIIDDGWQPVTESRGHRLDRRSPRDTVGGVVERTADVGSHDIGAGNT